MPAIATPARIDTLLRTAREPLTSYHIADAILSRPAAPWEWFAIDGILAGMIINGESETGRIRRDKPRGGRSVYRWQKCGKWYYCHTTKALEFGAGSDDTAERAARALSAARDDVIGTEHTVKRGRPPKPRQRESVYTMALNY